jgi:hypothetical protein
LLLADINNLFCINRANGFKWAWMPRPTEPQSIRYSDNISRISRDPNADPLRSKFIADVHSSWH